MRRLRLTPWSELDQRGRRRWRNNVLLGVLFVLFAAPTARGVYDDHLLDSRGVQVTATAIGANAVQGAYGVVFHLDPSLDPDQRDYSATVVQATYVRAQTTRTVPVVVVPGRPAVHRVVGQVPSHAGLIFSIAADIAVLLLGVILWRAGSGRRRSEPLLLVALADVEPVDAAAEDAVEEIRESDDGTYVVLGEVVEITRDGVELYCGEQRVVVDLAGHTNTVEAREPARVWGRLPDSTP